MTENEKKYIEQRIADGASVADISSELGYVMDDTVRPLDETPAEEAKYEYAANCGRNHEYYKDPTYHNAVTNLGDEALIQKEREKYYKPSTIREPIDIPAQPPVYKREKSKRYEVIGLIMRICDLAGYELAERVVLRDKATGRILW